MHPFHKSLVAALLAAVASAPVLAKGNDKHDKHGKHDDRHGYVQQHEGKHHKHARKHGRDHDRHHAHGGYERAGCPPGLAKKHNGCLPPGQAKKLAVGHPLPPGAVYTIPRHVRADLPPPPPGYRYAVVHNQVVLVSRDLLVVDILRSLIG
ncbi:MAG TPA: hypothetical protein VNB23_16430 [Ramlibacter sp.]|nr:hypothetical protein [Ramlibacter sp.]